MGCTLCSNPDTCVICNNSNNFFILEDKKCYSCGSHWIKCENDSGCTECSSGYYPKKYKSESCNTICKIWDNPNTCLSCKDGYYLDNDSNCQKCSSNCK